MKSLESKENILEQVKLPQFKTLCTTRFFPGYDHEDFSAYYRPCEGQDAYLIPPAYDKDGNLILSGVKGKVMHSKQGGKPGKQVKELPDTIFFDNPEDLGLSIDLNNNPSELAKLIHSERLVRNQNFLAVGFETDDFIREKTKKEKLIAKKKVEATRSFNASRLVHFYNETSANERKLFILCQKLLKEIDEKNGNEPT